MSRTMKAVVTSAVGGPDALVFRTGVAVPQLGPGQMLVRNEWIGVNYIDTYVHCFHPSPTRKRLADKIPSYYRNGLYPAPLPLTVGAEGAGVIESVHESVAGFHAGDRVAYLTPERGAYAQFTAVRAANTLLLPQTVSTRTVAASLLQGLTAITLIRDAHPVKATDWVLVTAAAGGVGSVLCEMLATTGAKVIGTAGTPEKMEQAKRNGAHWCLNSRATTEEIISQVRSITGGHGVDAVYDGVGQATFDMNFELAAPKATICTYGNASGPVPPFDVKRLGPKNLKLCRPVVFHYMTSEEDFQRYATELVKMLANGTVKLRNVSEYLLEDARQAHVDLEARETVGKYILKAPS
ncbi:hypothetical protein Sste5344_006283 [Sporothrix stenoceras]